MVIIIKNNDHFAVSKSRRMSFFQLYKSLIHLNSRSDLCPLRFRKVYEECKSSQDLGQVDSIGLSCYKMLGNFLYLRLNVLQKREVLFYYDHEPRPVTQCTIMLHMRLGSEIRK